jgi:DNA polymerase-3 subunit epsilon
MTPWWEGELVVFDTETTGKEYETARIVTSCIAWLNGDGSVKDAWEVLLNPGVEIEPEATAVHGITNEMAADGTDPKYALPGIANTLYLALTQGIPVVAFNARFDFTVLDRDCRRHEVPTLDTLTAGLIRPVLDPYVLDKSVDQYRKGSRKLGDMCAFYGVELKDWHSARADAVAAGRLTQAIVKKYRGLQIPLERLHRAQEIYAAQQARSLERYLQRKENNPDIRCEPEWPLVPHEEAFV